MQQCSRRNTWLGELPLMLSHSTIVQVLLQLRSSAGAQQGMMGLCQNCKYIECIL